MAARDYSPHLGTFTQQDSYQGSAANPASMNRFLYAHANPTTLIDPDGHRALEADGYVAPTYVPHSAESVSSTTYVSSSTKASSMSTTWTPTSRTDRDDWETNYVAPVDCGFARLGCRDDWIARGAGLSMGLGQTGWDLVAGVWDLGAGVVDDTLCSVDPVCARQRYLDAQARSALFWDDPLGNVGRGVDDLATGIGSGLQQLNDSIFHARSGFEGWRSFGHATGTVVTIAAPGIGWLRGTKVAQAVATGPARLAQDIVVNPVAPRALPLARAISQSSTQNAQLQAHIAHLIRLGARDIRVNQHQVNAAGVRVGINRPDLQYTLNGIRRYEEWETRSLADAWAHAPRIHANDSLGSFVPRRVP
jgi:hypothetical protein